MLDNRFEDKDRLDREAFASVEGFGAMAARYYNRVFFTALAVVREREMAEDIAQETFFRVWMTRENLRGKTVALQPWLTAIARNLAVDWQRKGQQRSRVLQLISMEDLPVEPVSNKSESPREAAASAEAYGQVNLALEMLPDELRQVIFLHYGEEMSASDIARMNGEAVSTVTRRLDRARRMVREQLESGLAAGIAVMKPNRRAVERLLAALTGAAALGGTAQAKLVELLKDTPAPILAESVGVAGAGVTAAKVAGGMTLGKWAVAAGIAVVCVGGAGLVSRWSAPDGEEQAVGAGKTRILAMDSGSGVGDVAVRTVGKNGSGHAGDGLRRGNGEGATEVPGTALASGPSVASEEVAGYVTIRGLVCDEETSEPLPKAEVYGIAPAADLRMTRQGEDAKKRVRVVADDKGRYEIRLPMAPDANTFSLDAFSPGYRSLAGTYTSGGDFSKHGVTAKAGDELDLTLALPKALYVAGRVVDEEGKGVAGVEVEGTIEYAEKGMAYIAQVETDNDGWFEIHDYMVNPWYETKTPDQFIRFSGKLEFKAEDRLTTSIANIYPLDAEVRANLMVVMPQGEVGSGQVVDAAGRPGARLPLYIEMGNIRDRSRYERRDVKTDDGGFFSLKGLPEGEARICVRDMKLDQWENTTVTVPVKGDLTLRMHATPYADTSKAVELLGMKLADVTPELKAKYDLWSTTGVVVLDVGSGASRIDSISKKSLPAEGDQFFVVGMKKISNLREFAEEMLKVNALPKPDGFVNEGYEGYVRVAYIMQPSRGNGSNTQYMKISLEDVRRLEQFLEETKTKQ